MSYFLDDLNFQTELVEVLVIFLVYYFKNKIKYKLPPGPMPIPLIGNLEVMRSTFMHEVFAKYKEKYGPVFKVYLGPFQIVVLNDIQTVTEALVKRKSEFANRPLLRSVHEWTEGGKDIAMANVTPTWKVQRKIALQALRKFLLGNQLEIILHSSFDKVLPLMAQESEEKGAFNPEQLIDLLIFNIQSAICFGKSVDLDDPDFRLMAGNKNKTEAFGKLLVEDILPDWALKYWASEKYKALVNIGLDILKSVNNKIEDHKKNFDPDNIKDLTDFILLAKNEAKVNENGELHSHMTDVHVRQTIMDIFNAGIDTSRITLYFAVRYMAGLPEIQKKCQQEIDRVVGNDRYPGIGDREKLSYTEATLHESMRLGMAAPHGLLHATSCNTQVGGYDIPKGTMVMINHYALHRDPNYWKDVEKFDPTRYIDENGKLGMKPESWLPFSAGRRVCLGETVAKPELHLIVAALLQRFHIKLPEWVSPEMKIKGGGGIMQPANFEVIFEKRF